MKKDKRRKTAWILLLIVAVYVGLSFLLSSYGLMVTHYSVPSKQIAEPLRIVQLTDLHNSVFGAHNRRLIRIVAAQEPDLILITGDLLNLNEERTDIAEELIRELSAVAPVYVSFGNHEDAYERNYGADLRGLYTKAGATVLEYDWADLTVKGQTLRLGGIFGYCLPPEYVETGEARPRETAFLTTFQDTDDYTILMCHMPYSWLVRDALDGWNVDLVLCGHVHGGQVRFPWIGGLWAPDQGWFPGKECGLYWSEDDGRVMVLSRGLGNTDKLPRFNNIPELAVIDLTPE